MKDHGYKMPMPYRGTASGKTGSGASGIPSEGIGAQNQGSAAGKVSSGLVPAPSCSIDATNRGSQPAGK